MLRAHHKMINELFPNRIITITIPDQESKSKDNFYYLRSPSKIEKLVAVSLGYSPDLSLKSINLIIKIIKDRKPDTIFIERSLFGNLIKKIKHVTPDVKVIAYFTDIEAYLLKQELLHCSIKRKLIINRLLKNEQLTVKLATKTFVLNKRDERIYIETYGASPNSIIPIIVSHQNVITDKDIHKPGERLELLFIGGDFWPNVEGIRWFIDYVLPNVSIPYALNIIGLNMEKYRIEFEKKSKSIHVLGTIDDIKPYMLSADIFIAPILHGSGMKVKTAEALSFGKTFLGLKESLVGYYDYIPEELRETKIIQCNNETDMATHINSLYSEVFFKCDSRIKHFIESICSYEVNIKKFAALFE